MKHRSMIFRIFKKNYQNGNSDDKGQKFSRFLIMIRTNRQNQIQATLLRKTFLLKKSRLEIICYVFFFYSFTFSQVFPFTDRVVVFFLLSQLFSDFFFCISTLLLGGVRFKIGDSFKFNNSKKIARGQKKLKIVFFPLMP